MSRRLGVLGALSLALIVVGCNPPKDSLIIPGKRVGNIVIGRTKASDIDDRNGHLLEVYNTRGLGIGVDDRLRVNAIEVTQPNYSTAKGIRVGENEDAVVTAYGEPEIVDVPLTTGTMRKGTLAKRALHYPGIRFLVNDQHQITSIIVSSQ